MGRNRRRQPKDPKDPNPTPDEPSPGESPSPAPSPGEAVAGTPSLDGVAADRRDVERLKNVMSSCPDWINFTSLEAPWMAFSSNKLLSAAIAEEGACCKTLESAEAWVKRVEILLHNAIIDSMLGTQGLREVVRGRDSEDDLGRRAALFRSLGRGWILIQVSRKSRKWKWWFENVDRVLRNRQHDIQ